MTKDGHMSAGALVKEAIVSLKERTGSSSHAIRVGQVHMHAPPRHQARITFALRTTAPRSHASNDYMDM
jgi:hypothetical protein